MKILAAIFFLFLLPNNLLGVTHYVSKTGSNIPPYTSWATAADSIQKAINVSVSADTVRVGPGVYAETLVLATGIKLIGSGMDSTTIDGVGVGQNTITTADSNLIDGFWIKGNTNSIVSGLFIQDTVVEIANNRISSNFTGINMAWGPALIENNVLTGGSFGIRISVEGKAVIQNNLFENNGAGISSEPTSQVTARNNIIRSPTFGGFGLYYSDLAIVENNLVYNVSSDFGAGIVLYLSSGDQAFVINNTVQGDSDKTNRWGISMQSDVFEIPDTEVIVNNIATGFDIGIRYIGMTTHDPIISYNCMWENNINQLTMDNLDTGNIFVDPMFADDTSDFHLQYASPCVDAGDPTIKDPDSSRSDIGTYGGPLGQVYIYQDLAPDVPESLDATSEQTAIRLTWRANTESDLGGYVIYKDSISGFPADSFHAIAIVSRDSISFLDTSWTLNQIYYYRIAAFDTARHLSTGSPEIMVVATDVKDNEPGPSLLPKDYELRQNYPNPFNARTTIVYNIPNLGPLPALVEITLHNILGQMVRTLVKERQSLGEHRVNWDGRDDRGEKLPSGVYLCQMKVWGYQVSKPIKVVLMR